jgi:hypothetical protein
MERDRAIRKERRDRLRGECEARRIIRLAKERARESVKRNGVPQIKPDDSRFGFREAVAHLPLVDCSRCHALVREFYGTLCERCHYSKEVNDENENELKARVNKAVPGKGDGGNETIALVGQLTLKI